MARFTTKKQPSAGNTGGGAPWVNLTYLLRDPSKDIIDSGDTITIKGELVDGALSEFYPDMKIGDTVNFVVNQGVDKVRTQIDKIGRHLGKDTYMTAENARKVGDDVVIGWSTNFCRVEERDVYDDNTKEFLGSITTTVPLLDAYVKVKPLVEFEKDGEKRTFQNVEIYKTEEACAVVGPDLGSTKAKLMAIVEEMKQDADTMADPVYADWVAKVERFDSLSGLEKVEVVFNHYAFLDDFTTLASGGYNAVLRVIELGGDLSERENFSFANIMGGMQGMPDADGNMEYSIRLFGDSLGESLVAKDRKGEIIAGAVSYEDILSKGIREAMASRAVDDGEGGIRYENPFITGLVEFVEFLESEESLDAEANQQLLFEVLPVVKQKVGGDTLEHADKLAAPYNMKMKPFEKNGKEYQNTRNVIGKTSLLLMARKNGSYFVAKDVPQITFGFNKDVRLSHEAYSPATLPTPATAAIEGLNEHLSGHNKNMVKMFDPREWKKDTSNSNEQDSDPEQENNNENDSAPSP